MISISVLVLALWLCQSTFSLSLSRSIFTFDGHLIHGLVRRKDCKTINANHGDSCASLAQRCGISPADFTKYNPDKNLCSSLISGRRICCSAGALPDIRPKRDGDGLCAPYTVRKSDTCGSIAVANGLEASDIDDFNKIKTWGFDSCHKGLRSGSKICLSDGDAPMPAPVDGAVCGPTKPGTEATARDSDGGVAGLNPCPLNACCNIWGQCGISGDFCNKTTGEFGNPGTGPPGSNGCASSCGQDIANNDKAPDSFISVGYYESWNMDRPCLTMSASSLAAVNPSYTHIHWGFGKISRDLSVDVNDTYHQWEDFKRLSASGVKTILSLGGWGDSTSPATHDILRIAVSPGGRERFTDKLVDFVEKHGLSGVDIDWEYPGAPDIPAIPPGEKEDGENYLAMLQLLRSKLDRSRSLSIAAPASYWYLRPFPVDKMAELLDYIVYMTYDLHGQWDQGSKWAQAGCPNGNCLRSHVNLTETLDALSMITKAGVPSKKIVVGVSSYGRSFKMTDPNCRGPMCTFEGTNTSSPAQPGECTDARGYISNAEIDKILHTNQGSQSWYDNETDSDFLVYNSNEWVSYMKEETKQSRSQRWLGLNFAGIVDWAVDLQQFSEDEGCPAGTCASPGTLYVGQNIFEDESPAIECDPPCQLIFPPFILPQPTTISFPPMTTSLEIAWTELKVVTDNHGVKSTKSSISRIVQNTTLEIPPVTTTAINFWNQNLNNVTNASHVWLTWSILPSPFVITEDPNPENKTDVKHPEVTRTIRPPPWPYSFSKSKSQPTSSDPSTMPTTTSHTGTATFGSSKIPLQITIRSQRGPPGPVCTSKCGHRCTRFCHTPCPPAICPYSRDNDDFWSPADPNPPPGPPPRLGPPPAGSGTNMCQPEVKTETGLCSNGNYPIWDPLTTSVRCDLPPNRADELMTQCQRNIDGDLERSKERAGLSTSCCLIDIDFDKGLKAKAAPAPAKACPKPPDYRKNAPSNGKYHSIFTCSYDKWPNVCANARSAIEKRGKTDILTYSPYNKSPHLTRPWYHGKHGKSGYGWRLSDCQVEEYPFASGDPNRNPNQRKWSDQRVLRLIPAKENEQHGAALMLFYKDAGNGETKNADGLIYSMAFEGGPSGTATDDDFYLGNDISKNICAKPYGNAFLLVNAARVGAGEPSYDPWWDDKLIKKTISYFLDKRKTATSSVVTDTVSEYCRYPSPGSKTYNEATAQWESIKAGMDLERKMGNLYYKCDSFPGYAGPAALPPAVRRRWSEGVCQVGHAAAGASTDLPQLEALDANMSTGACNTVASPENIATLPPRHAMDENWSPLSRRQAVSGSFLDPSAFLYLGCGAADDGFDPCANTDLCSTDSSEGHLDDDGGWGAVSGDADGDKGGDSDDPAQPPPTKSSAPPEKSSAPPAKSSPTLGDQVCSPVTEHDDVLWDRQSVHAEMACDQFKSVFKLGEPGELYRSNKWSSGCLYSFRVSWVKGCTKRTEQSISQPLPGNKFRSVTCLSLMRENYQKCNNGGSGGSREADCLKYDFFAGIDDDSCLDIHPAPPTLPNVNRGITDMNE